MKKIIMLGLWCVFFVMSYPAYAMDSSDQALLERVNNNTMLRRSHSLPNLSTLTTTRQPFLDDTDYEMSCSGPLMSAVQNNDHETLATLKHFNRHIPTDHHLLLLEAAEKGNSSVFFDLLTAKNTIKQDKDGKITLSQMTESKDFLGTCLVCAARGGDESVVSFLTCTCNVDPNTTKALDVSPLLAACEQGHVSVANHLIRECGANVNEMNSCGSTPLLEAYCSGNFDLVSCLEDNGADLAAPLPNGMMPLHAACHGGNVRIAQHLVENYGADFYAYALSPLLFACRNNKPDIIRFAHQQRPIPDNIKRRLVRTACNRGYTDVARCLVEECDIKLWRSSDGKEAVGVACANGYFDLVHYLVEAQIRECQKIKPNISVEDAAKQVVNMVTCYPYMPKCLQCNLWITDDLGTCQQEHPDKIDRVEFEEPSYLHLACSSGRKDIAQYLIGMGASTEDTFDSKRDNAKFNALHCACMSGNLDLVMYMRELLALAEPGKKAKKRGFWRNIFKKKSRRNAPEGHTFLHVAAERSSWPVIEYLLANEQEGQDLLAIRNSCGNTPLMCAARMGNKGVANGLIMRKLKLTLPTDAFTEEFLELSVFLEQEKQSFIEDFTRDHQKYRDVVAEYLKEEGYDDQMSGAIMAYVNRECEELPADLDKTFCKELKSIVQIRQKRLSSLGNMIAFVKMRQASILASILCVLNNRFIVWRGGSSNPSDVQRDLYSGTFTEDSPSPLLGLPIELLLRIARLAYGHSGALWQKSP